MKVCIIQPPYSGNYADSRACFQKQLELMDQCDPSMDVIVLPESCDIPSLARTKEESEASSDRYNKTMVDAAIKLAKRCSATVFFNARSYGETGTRNTTYTINRQGEIVGKYYKEHLTPGEVSKMKLDSGYTFEPTEPIIVEVDGVRYAFLVCYDFYFYEMFPQIARYRPDVIIGCSHQRSDSHDALEIMGRFLCYNTNAWLFRSSVSMDENSDIGGGSMIVAPDGQVVFNMKSRVGLECAEVDVTKKFYKPAGYGNPPSAHWEYIEKGRRPWKYRPAGAAIVPTDDWMGYPRVCAHRGFNTVAPENSLPAFGAAIAMGAEEIEFDLWVTADGEIVSCHDSTLDRVSTGTGKVYDYTYEELLAFDFGIKRGEEFKGIKVLRFEEILRKFAGHAVMNIHLKTRKGQTEYDPAALKKIVTLIDRYDCRKHVYFMCGVDGVLAQLQRDYPDICRCCGAGDGRWEIVDRALRYGCKKVQLFKPYFNQEMIDRAHANGIICNVFWSDNPEETETFLSMGIDTILTNDYNRIAQVVRTYKTVK
ncbi:MAG: hypothetical protein J6C26_02915 [Clostridia bacterium]|nr:hypothetical protein [Clostridia bacterium]